MTTRRDSRPAFREGPATRGMHEALAGYAASGEIPGMVALVAQRGQVHVEAIGTTEIAVARPVARDTIFRVASMTKPVTAASTMILIEDGALSLDEPVERLLPELANRRVLRRFDAELDDTVAATRSITVRDLLTFTFGSGMAFVPPGTYPIQRALDKLELMQGPPRPQVPPAPDVWLARFATLPLMHQPGARWMYHTGSEVLGVLIARACRGSFDAFVRERIFEPLGMVDTGFSVPAGKLERFVASYLVDPPTQQLTLHDPIDGQWSKPPAFPSGGGGLVSTVDDFLAFGEMLLGGGTRGNVRILSEASVNAMMCDQLTPAQRAASNDFAGLFDEHSWGFGGSVVTGHDVAGSPGTYGWNGGLGTVWRVDRQREAVTILLTQRAWSSPLPPPVCGAFWRSAGEMLGE
jgi:CubicO group peptidase (beta-lactamase class C family)